VLENHIAGLQTHVFIGTFMFSPQG